MVGTPANRRANSVRVPWHSMLWERTIYSTYCCILLWWIRAGWCNLTRKPKIPLALLAVAARLEDSHFNRTMNDNARCLLISDSKKCLQHERINGKRIYPIVNKQFTIMDFFSCFSWNFSDIIQHNWLVTIRRNHSILLLYLRVFYK